MEDESSSLKKHKQIEFPKNFINPKNVILFVLLVEIIKWAFILLFDNYRNMYYSTYDGQATLYLNGVRKYNQYVNMEGPCHNPALDIYLHVILKKITSDAKNPYAAILWGTLWHLLIWFMAVKIYQEAFEKHSSNVLLVTICCFGIKYTWISVKYAYGECYSVFVVLIAVYLFQKGYSILACAAFSVALGLRIHMMYYLPGIFLILCLSKSFWKALFLVGFIIFMQFVWAIEFISLYPTEYFSSVLDANAIFDLNAQINQYKWVASRKDTLRYLVDSHLLNVFLVIIAVLTWIYLLLVRWLPLLHPDRELKWDVICRSIGFELGSIFRLDVKLSPYFVAEVLLLSNYIWLLWARTLHEQFTVYYWYSLPFLMYPILISNKIELGFVVCFLVILDWSYSDPKFSTINTFFMCSIHMCCMIGNYLVKTPGSYKVEVE